jgi:polysaccharide chain length determinant protein (PEP-CTERM system associated)
MLPGKKLTAVELLRLLRRRAWLLIVPPLVIVFPALIYSSTIKNTYESDMLISIDPQRVPDAFVRSTITLGTELRMDAIAVKVRSRTNLQSMIEEFDLYQEERQRMPMEDVVGLMNDSIKVELERSRDALTGREVPNAFHVKFTHPDPNIAARVTQQLGSLFVEQNSRDRGALASATNEFLDTQLGEARARLVEQETRLEGFRQKHGKELPTQMLANLQTLQATQQQVQSLVESIARDRDQKLLLDRLYRDAEAMPVAAETVTPIQGGAPTVSQSPEQQLNSARALLANLELRYKPDHPDVLRTKQLIETLEPQVKRQAQSPQGPAAAGPVSNAEMQKRERLLQMGAQIESLERQITFKTNQEKQLRAQVTEYQRRVEAVPGLESQWVSLTRDYDTQQIAYRDLLTKSGAAKVAADLEEQQIGEHFRIVDPATVPVRPLPSIRMQINMAGLALGLFLGVGIAALLEIRDTTYRDDTDIVDVLSLPVLASVPYVTTARELRNHRLIVMAVSVVAVASLAGAGYVAWTMKLWNSLT